MKTKNKITLLLSIFVINTIFAITPSSLYDRDSFVVTSIDYLARSSSITGIYDNFPATGASVLKTFNQIDRYKLNSVEKSLYDQILVELNRDANLVNNEEENFAANVEIPITIEGTFYSTSDGSKLKRYELDDQFKDVNPWIDFRSQLYFGDNLYGYTQFAIKDSLTYDLTDDAPFLNYNLNSFSILPNSGSSFEIYQPFKIGLSAGDEKYNFQIGKNRLSTGSGISGNFFIGDNFTKQDYASFSLFSSLVTYTVSVTEFDQQIDSLNFGEISFSGKQQYRVMHRATFYILKNLSLDIYQGSIYQVDDLNFRMIIPFMYVHNYFNFADDTTIDGNDEANNIFGIQTKWVMSKGNEFNFIVSFDQIQLFESAAEFPQAYGLLLNYKNSRTINNGILANSFEIAYTSPYLYLNNKKDTEGSVDYNYDHIYGNNYGTHDEIGYGGYYYGPDTLMLSYYLKYTDLDNWNIGANLSLRIHGDTGIDVTDNDHDLIDSPLRTGFIVGTPETIISFIPSGSIALTNYLNVKGYLDFSGIINHYHKTSSPFFFDIQGKISAKFNIL